MPTKGEITREALLKTALTLFRRQGFDGTTMRDIAQEAGLSVGASYRHFKSKEDIVAAYYARVQDKHEERVPHPWPADMQLAERLRILFAVKLDIVARDRRFLAALFRAVAEPDNPLGVFSAATSDVRRRSIALFGSALQGAIDPPLATPIATALWLAHLAVLLRLVHDRSKGGAATSALAREAADAIASFIQLISLPMARSLLTEPLLRIWALASDP